MQGFVFSFNLLNIYNTMKNIIVMLITIIPLLSISQKQGNIWYFGNHAGLDFNSGVPIPITNGQTSFSTCINENEGSSVISDDNGSLLFYSDGQTIWNKNHQIMPNGNGLLGNPSSTQSSIIVPLPLNNRYFYIFTTDAFTCGSDLGNGFRYSVIDICSDNQNGDIIPNKKNILLLDTVCEKVTVTRHANGIDYWILTHQFFSDKFYAFLLTSNGITDTVISAIGSIHNGSIWGAIGQLKFSFDGQKIAIGAGNGLDILDIFDFDKSTGIISNSMSLYKPNNNSAGIYGVEFSSDNTKLYVTGISDLGAEYGFLVQYDLSAGGGNIDSINASLYTIYINSTGQISLKGLQIGIDKKIYMVSYNNDSMLSVINNPNLYGLGCNYQYNSISLANRKGSYTLPSFIAGYNYSNTTYNCSAGIEELSNNSQLILYQNEPNPFGDNTVIRYFIPENTKSTAFIVFYDIYGKEIKKAELTTKGFGNVNANTENLASGIYSYSLIVNERVVDTKKMIKQ